MLCPTLDISRVSNISTVMGKEESRVGPGGGEVWPGREESSQVRGEEERKVKVEKLARVRILARWKLSSPIHCTAARVT
jgi:hypothetical protein